MTRINPLWRLFAVAASAMLLMMMMSSVVVVGGAVVDVQDESINNETKFCFKCLFRCPNKHDKYDAACLRSVIPPWPICKFHSVTHFVEHARDSASRCCGDDTSACRCPKKQSSKFLNHIDEWCKGVASCGCRDGEDCPQEKSSSSNEEEEDTMMTLAAIDHEDSGIVETETE